MNSKNTKKPCVALFCLLVFLLSFCVGCNYGGETNDQDKSVTDSQSIISYISTDSRIYGSTADVVAAVADTVVEIQTESVTAQWGMQYVVSGAGSGVIASRGGSQYYIITNNHVIDGASDITVTTRKGEKFTATLLATDDSADLAVIVVDSDAELSIAVWGNSDELNIGDDLIAIGNPLGNLGGTVTKGILSASGRKIAVGNYYMTLLQTDTAINPGNSGGGLFNMRGELIGIVNAKTSDEEVEGICFAIPGNTARHVYDDLVQYGYIKGRATLNVTVAEGTITSGLNSQSQSIVYVTGVSDAAENAFSQYDRIATVNGIKISTVLEYNDVLSKIKPEEEIVVEVYRGTKMQGPFGGISFLSEITEFNVIAAQYGIN